MSADWSERLLAYAHIGDLHVTDARERNYRDFLAIVAEIAAIGGPALDFVYLPGDNADNGRREQYDLVAIGLRMAGAPVHVVTGDHDMEQGSLDAFHAGLGARALPYVQTVRGVDCVFLDMCGAGAGGPNFRLPAAQTDLLRTTVETAKSAGRRVAVFTHTYPADLRDAGERAALNAALADPVVRLVDMGHTHYNELANDGRTIFAATRSTGQIEEGPVGYSIAAVDGDAVSWRFKLLDESCPFVQITAPADRRLATGPTPAGAVEVHALALSPTPVDRCEARVDDGAWTPMRRTPDGRGWEATLGAIGAPARIEARAFDADGRPGYDEIEFDPQGGSSRARCADGSDRDAVGAWPQRHILGSQLGPNRNGRKPS